MESPAFTPTRILVVDDDVKLCHLIRDYLEPLGYDVAMAHNGPAGVELACKETFAALILDLEERGLLDRTLVVLASEFGRDAVTEGKVGLTVKDQSNTPDVMQEPKHYGMHRHFTGAGSVLLFGGGIKKGKLYGKTADERPCTTVENPVPVENLHATIYQALGIAANQAYVVEKRPVFVTKDGKGQAVQELFA